MIKLVHITKSFRRKSAEIVALDAINLEIQEGEMIALTGESGSGKTTLINILGALLKPTSGQYYFKGEMLAQNEDKLSLFRSGNIGFVLQNFSLIENRTIYHNLALPLVFKKTPKDQMEARVREIAGQLGIGDKLRMFPRNLSGGECQRAAIARAVISKPSIILADEPTSSLDEKNKNEIIKILNDLNAAGITIVMATHDKALIDAGHRIVNLDKGRITI